MLEHEHKREFLKLIKKSSSKLTGHAFINIEDDAIELIIDSKGVEVLAKALEEETDKEDFQNTVGNIDMDCCECSAAEVEAIFDAEIETEDGTSTLKEACEELQEFNPSSSFSIIGDGNLAKSKESLIADSFLVQDFIGVFPSISS